jgi:pimeloyl-ACP methyl ester carboxylesterase
VLLPRDYETSGKRYPVVYMNDGQNVFFPEGFAGKSWRVGETLSALQSSGVVDDVIVVALNPLSRNREYTHTDWCSGTESGGVTAYGDYLAQHVKPFIDAQYRTRPDRESTLIVGSSHGGLAAFHVASTHGDVFGKAACLSSSFWAGVDKNRVHDPKADLASSSLLRATRPGLQDCAHRPSLWLDWGLKRDGGAHNSTTEFLATHRGSEMAALLQREFGYGPSELHTHVDAVGGHEEEAWAYRFGLLMQRFFPRPAP